MDISTAARAKRGEAKITVVGLTRDEEEKKVKSKGERRDEKERKNESISPGQEKKAKKERKDVQRIGLTRRYRVLKKGNNQRKNGGINRFRVEKHRSKRSFTRMKKLKGETLGCPPKSSGARPARKGIIEGGGQSPETP